MRRNKLKLLLPILHAVTGLVLTSCTVSTIPDITEVQKDVPINSSKSANLLLHNDLNSAVYLIEETVPDWIEIKGLKNDHLGPHQIAQVNLIASCGPRVEVKETSILLQSRGGDISKTIHVTIRCVGSANPEPPENPQDIPSPAPAPTPQSMDLKSYRGNPSFDDSQLTSTQQLWYRRVLAGIKGRHYDELAASDNLYQYSRDLHTYYQSVLLNFRVTGDLRLLDELVRLTDIQKTKLQDSWRNTLDGKTQMDGYLNWVWRGDSGNEAHYGKDVNMMDDIRTHSILTVLAYVLSVNRDLKSPTGYDYGKTADYWISHIENHFFKKWRERRNISIGSFRVFVKAATHPTYTIVKMNFYLYKLTGNANYLSEAEFWAEYLWKDVREVSAPTGDAFVYPHGLLSYYPESTVDFLVPTTYARYSSADMVELHFEEFHNWSSASNLEKFTRALTDFVMTNGANTMPRDIGGGVARGGYRPAPAYSEMPITRYRVSSYASLTAFDRSGKMRQLNEEIYEILEGNREAPKEIYIPTGMFFDSIVHEKTGSP